jgi:cell division septation protein DedD
VIRAGVAPALAGALAGLTGVAAWAQDPPSFPRSLEREPLLAWLQRETDITPERVVAVTPQALTAIVSTFPAGGGQGPRVVIRAEALNGETFARTGALSWHVSMSADCDGHRVRLGDTTGYPQRNLLGERRVLRAAEGEWRRPEPGTALDNAWRAACDAKFRGPFQADAMRVAQADAPAPAPQAAPPQPPPPAAVATPPPQRTAPPPKVVAAKPAPASSRPPPPKPPSAKPAPSKPTPLPIAPALRPAAPATAGGLSVQIGAFPDQSSANAALARLGDGQSHATEAAVVGGRTWYRAVVGGFGSAEAASRYCAARKSKGGVCFVRGR